MKESRKESWVENTFTAAPKFTARTIYLDSIKWMTAEWQKSRLCNSISFEQACPSSAEHKNPSLVEARGGRNIPSAGDHFTHFQCNSNFSPPREVISLIGRVSTILSILCGNERNLFHFFVSFYKALSTVNTRTKRRNVVGPEEQYRRTLIWQWSSWGCFATFQTEANML